jgi:hypothetical protein
VAHIAPFDHGAFKDQRCRVEAKTTLGGIALAFDLIPREVDAIDYAKRVVLTISKLRG